MGIFDYFTVSRLRGQELFDYVEKLTQSTVSRKYFFDSLFSGVLSIFQRNLLTLNIFLVFLISVSFFYFGDLLMGIVFSALFIGFLVAYLALSLKLSYFRGIFSKLSEPRVKVVRSERVFFVPKDEVKVGDIVIVEEGMKVFFDIRLLESRNLVVDESLVFGEDRKVNKHAGTLLNEELKLYELSNIIFKNSVVVSGYGKGIVFNNPKEHERLSKVDRLFFRGGKRVVYNLVMSLFSFLLSFVVFFVFRKLILSLGIFFVSLLVLSPSFLEKFLVLKVFNFMDSLVREGVIIGNPFLLLRLSEANKVFINLKQTSFVNTKTKIFFPDVGKYLSYENFLDADKIPYEKLIYTYILVSFIYAKQKRVDGRVFLTSCLNLLKSLIPESYLSSRLFSILQYSISDDVNGNSFVELSREGGNFRLESIPLKVYFSEMGDLPGLDYGDGEGMVVLKVENGDIEVVSVVLFEKVQSDLIKINSELGTHTKVYFTSFLSKRDLKKLFEAVNIEFGNFAGIDVNDMKSVSQEEIKFYLDKFNLFCKVSDDFLVKFFPLFLGGNCNVSVFAFYDSPYGKIEISNFPNISKNSSNTIFVVGEDAALPLRIVSFSKKVAKLLEKLRVAGVIVGYLFSLLVSGILLFFPVEVFVIIPLMLFVYFYCFSLLGHPSIFERNFA